MEAGILILKFLSIFDILSASIRGVLMIISNAFKVICNVTFLFILGFSPPHEVKISKYRFHYILILMCPTSPLKFIWLILDSLEVWEIVHFL